MSSEQPHPTADEYRIDSEGDYNNLLTIYLTEMAQEPLLMQEEEIELAQQIEHGRIAQKAMEETSYTAEEFARLQALVDAGLAARNHLGRANTRLVVSIAKRYRGYGIPFLDLIQDGNIGLMSAVDHYDHRTGNRFSTYATWWIRQTITRGIADQGKTIRIPVHVQDKIRAMKNIIRSLQQKSGQDPTIQEIADEMGIRPDKVAEMILWDNQILSLEEPVGDDANSELRDFIEDIGATPPDEQSDSLLLSELLQMPLESLTVRELQVLRLRYIYGYTLNEIGEIVDGLSRERVRQIIKEAHAKLRLISPPGKLEQFL